MGFFDEFLNLFGVEEIDTSYKIIVLGKSGVMIEGYKKLLTLSDTQILLLLKNIKLNLIGKGLYIKKMEKSEIVVGGTITHISFE